ncbi:BTB/POZ domain-containing protein FBL11 isoform X1 [Sesamum indicum]|uniref:BTB/POZ domain-containing protein FBL11 isoform X1 n=1 Tax=Sesamum indicum TaxID=4182 RepID=A0A8M8V0T1_SESIN|nr:BTB/POZ domain-containing protein FBL11 isoform X1 [Sesamum indicum]
MASIGDEQHTPDLITLICSEFTDSDPDEEPDEFPEIVLSTADISSWDLPSVFAHKLLKIEVNPNRLIEESSYFRGLLSGSFSENGLTSVSIHWNVESFASVLRFILGCPVEITSDNFIPLNEAALFFGVETLLLKCHVWLEEVTSQSQLLCLDSLIDLWKYGLERANDTILQLCTSYLARNFMWALSFNSYTDFPDKLLSSCIEHPDLTVDSEKHLADAVLVWLTANTTKSEGWSCNDLCHKIRTGLLPLWFAAGKRRCHFFTKFADKATGAIVSLAGHNCMSLTDIFTEGCSSHLRIRLTKYTQKVDVSGCPQITAGLCLLSVLPSCDADRILSKIIKKSSANHANSLRDGFRLSLALGQVLTFEAVQELDISNCPSLFLESAINCFCKSFPSLRTLRAAYFSNFKTRQLGQWVQKFPLLTNIDLTLDITPVIPAKISIIASSSVPSLEPSTASSDIYNCQSATSLSYTSRPLPSNVIKLTLEGRIDISDSDLLMISEVCHSLSYINLKGCTSVTDHGIAVMILRCKILQSVLACDTSFQNNSILALSSGVSSVTQQHERHSQLIAHKLLTLHIGGCRGVTGKLLCELISGADNLRSLCLREIQLVDDALYRFSGASLEMLDVSDTEVSIPALAHVICRNPDLKSLKIRGCRRLLRQESETNERKLCIPSFTPQDLYSELGKSCKLEEFEVGWGFSYFSLAALKPAIITLRSLVVGLGGSLGHDGLKLLPTICPMLETLILYFQVISDSAITEILRTLPHLQFLALCYCFGDISSLSFNFNMPNLRNLKLERVTPWMTNEELATLAENCTNLVKLSLIGCTLLDSEAQAIISSGWPGLTSLHLEECGEITANGVRSLLDCHALEDLILRHTGCGIPRNFIIYAASKLPMLRKISLDVCDASESDFDIPSFSDRYFLSTVKIARCKLQKNTLDLHNSAACRSPVHKETLVLVWNSEKLVRTLVKERL